MDWQSSAWLARGEEQPGPAAVNAMVAGLPSSDPVLAALSTSRFEMKPFVANLGTVVLTSTSLLMAEDRPAVQPRVELTIRLADVRHSAVGPVLGAGPVWEVAFKTERGDHVSIHFGDPVNAEEFERKLHSAVRRQRAQEQPATEAARQPADRD